MKINITITLLLIIAISQAQTFIETKLMDSSSIVALPYDMDGDGNLDIISIVDDNGVLNSSLLITEFNANGVTQQHHIDGGIQLTSDISIADIDGDQDLDIVLMKRNGQLVVWYENLGNFQFVMDTISIESPLILFDVRTDDIDNDGDMDVIVATSGGVVWYTGTSTLNGYIFGRIGLGAIYQSAKRIELIDFDNDNDTDIVAVSISDSITVHFNQFGVFTEFDLNTTFPGFYGLRTADMNGDGKTDLVCSSNNTGEVAWFENVNGNALLKHSVDSGNISCCVIGLDVFDYDGDGDFDIIVGDESDYNVRILKNSSLNFTQDTIGTNRDAYELVFVDIDNDNDIDVLAACYSSKQGVYIYYNQGLTVGEKSMAKSDLVIYPNPVAERLSLKGSFSRSQYRIMNIAGQTVLQGMVTDNSIELSNLLPGQYLIKLDNRKAYRFTKQ
jgi:hypothetical protein